MMPIGSLLTPTTAPPPLRRRLPCIARALSARRVGERPLENIYKVLVERGAAEARLAELGVERWSTWKSGKCRMAWNWHVDQLVYIVSGEVRVVPEGATSGEDHMHFVAGDLVRYPKWFEADLHFHGPYEERYRFLAYGDDN